MPDGRESEREGAPSAITGTFAPPASPAHRLGEGTPVHASSLVDSGSPMRRALVVGGITAVLVIVFVIVTIVRA